MKLHWAAELLPFLSASGLLLAAGLALSAWLARRPAARWTGWTLLALGLASAIVFLVFFRDPPRSSPAAPDKILSPADGTVVKVEETAEERFLGGRARRVAIFMSLTNVHVQRVPAAARLLWTDYRPGQFFPAFLRRAARMNEQRWYGFEHAGQRFVVVQVAGILARRIISWIKPEQTCSRGERLGMIVFGSEVDIYLPLSVRVTVRPGEPVRAGETVVGEWR